MKKGMFLLIGALLLSGCAVKKEMTAIGGSKADGTVKMGYSYGMFEMPSVDVNQAADAAAKRCKVWGYEGAEAFGGQTSECVQASSSGCAKTEVSVEYQCVGGKAAQH